MFGGEKSPEACNPAASEQRSQHARSCVHDSLLRVTAKKKYRTQAPYFYPRVKLPICNFHYNLVLKNDFYHPEERDFSLSLSHTSSTSRSFWQRAVWWNVLSSFFFVPPYPLAHFSCCWWMNECLGIGVGSPTLPFGFVRFVQSDMRLVTEDFTLPSCATRITYFTNDLPESCLYIQGDILTWIVVK